MVLPILVEIANTSSTNAKVAILQREKDNDGLKKVIVATLNPFINYYIKKIPEYSRTHPPIFLGDAMKRLHDFTLRKVTGNAAIDLLKTLLCGMHEYDAEVFTRIIERDLKCGVGSTLVNKVWPGLIPTFEVMLCHKDISGIKYPAFAQCKADGARCHLYWDGSNATAFARSGKQFELHGMLNESAAAMMEAGQTWDGELLVVDEYGNVLDRKTGNGILNKANKGTISPEEANRIIFVPWDIVDQTGTIEYKDRWNTISDVFVLNGYFAPKFRQIETRVVENEEEAQIFFEEMLAKGQEGAVLKNFNNVWQGKRVKSCGKMKAEETADLRVVGWVPGTGKYEGMIGALIVETECGKLRCNVGTGFSDDDRKKPPEYYLGAIVEVMYNQVITSKGKDTASLFLPRLMQVRFDKDVANTLGELK